MNRLLEYYGRIIDAPNAIARLRGFVLDLAVRGKLAPRDPGEEPASELLKRICDRLEASLAVADDTRRRLLDALLAEALAPAEQRELEAAE